MFRSLSALTIVLFVFCFCFNSYAFEMTASNHIARPGDTISVVLEFETYRDLGRAIDNVKIEWRGNDFSNWYDAAKFSDPDVAPVQFVKDGNKTTDPGVSPQVHHWDVTFPTVAETGVPDGSMSQAHRAFGQCKISFTHDGKTKSVYLY